MPHTLITRFLDDPQQLTKSLRTKEVFVERPVEHSEVVRNEAMVTKAASQPPNSETTNATEDEVKDQIDARRALRIAAGRHGDAIRRLQLDPLTASKIIALYAEGLRVQMDAGAAARKAGITDPEAIKLLAIQETAKVDLEIQQALGPALFKSLQEESAIFQEKRSIDLGFFPELTVSGDSLSPEQSYDLARAVFELKAGASSGRYPNVEFLDSAQFAAATKSLTTRQRDAFKQYYRDGAWLDASSESGPTRRLEPTAPSGRGSS